MNRKSLVKASNVAEIKMPDFGVDVAVRIVI